MASCVGVPLCCRNKTGGGAPREPTTKQPCGAARGRVAHALPTRPTLHDAPAARLQAKLWRVKRWRGQANGT